MAAANQPIVLMYHRVARLEHDPWQLAVTPENFRSQIEALKRVRRVVPFSEILDRPAGGPPTAAITFDDGYADVFETARPILESLEAPATLFLTTDAVGDEQGFWWDRLARIFFAPEALPDQLDLVIAGQRRTWQVPPGLDGRKTVHDEVWALLRAADAPERGASLAELATWAGVPGLAAPEDRVMTEAQVRDLRGSTLSIGAHTLTHPSLPTLGRAAKTEEMARSRARCESWAEAPVDIFAYPFGDHDDSDVEVAAEVGFKLACTTQFGGVSRRTDPLRIPRLAVDDMDGAAFARWLP